MMFTFRFITICDIPEEGASNPNVNTESDYPPIVIIIVYALMYTYNNIVKFQYLSS